MKNFILKAMESMSDKINSPMLSSTATAWVLINYKFIMVIFSKDDFRKKFDYIENCIYLDENQKICYQIIYPLLIGIFYTLIYPLLDIFFVSIREYINNLRDSCILKISRKRPIDIETIKEFYEKHDAIIESKTKALAYTVDALRQEQVATRKQIADLRKRLKRQTIFALCGHGYLNPKNIFFAFQSDGSFRELADHNEISSGFIKIKNKDSIIFVINNLLKTSADENGNHFASRQQLDQSFDQDDSISDAIEFLIALGIIEEIDGTYKIDDINGLESARRLKSLLTQPRND